MNLEMTQICGCGDNNSSAPLTIPQISFSFVSNGHLDIIIKQ